MAEIFDLRTPQKSLGQWPVPKYVLESEISPKVILPLLHRLLGGPKLSHKTILWSSSQAALTTFMQANHLEPSTARIGSWKPSPIALEATQTLVEISRDPSEWTRNDFANCDLIVLPNPALWDGYFLPDELLDHALKQIHKLAPHLPVVIDQRNLVFSWEDLAPTEVNELDIQNPYLILGSTHPVLAPNISSEIAWTQSSMILAAHETELNIKALQEAHFMISSFKTKQGPFAQEFQKVMLVVRESLKRLSSELQLMSEDMNFKISHWPTCGLFLVLNTPNESSAKNLIAKFDDHGIKLLSGESFGDPTAVLLSYSMHLSQCDRLLRRLQDIRSGKDQITSAPLA